MKILHLIDYFQPKLGYQETFLAHEHQQSGHEVTVVTSDRYFPFPHYDSIYKELLGKRIVGKGIFIEEKIKTVRLKSIEIPFTNIIFLINLKKTLEEIQPDYVLCHGVYSPLAYFTAKLKKSLGFILVYDTHASYFNTDFNSNIFKKIYHYLFQKYYVPQIIECSDKMIAIGEQERDFICQDLKLSESMVPIIRLGVDTRRFVFKLKDRKEMRRKLEIKNNEIVIVYTGKITENKKLHLVFKAVEKLQKKEVKILIIGSGKKSYIDSLKFMAPKNKIIWSNFIENKKLPFFYCAADIAVWPGDPSIAMLEAMSCGLPLILKSDKETAYLDESSGIVRFQENNLASFIKALTVLIDNKKLYQELSRNAQNYIKRELSWKRIAEEFLVYNKKSC